MRLFGPTGDESTSVIVRTPQQEIAVSRPPLRAGLYTVAVSNCGRVGYAPAPLTVQNPAPQITTPLAANANEVWLCTTPTLRLRWKVQYVSRVLLMRVVPPSSPSAPTTLASELATAFPTSCRR